MRISAVFLLLVGASLAWSQDLLSGPEVGAKIPALSVFDATGPHQGKPIDYAADRQGKPTVFLFIQAGKWDRPMARFLRKLDEDLGKDALVVAVWLTEDADKTKDYLPKAQQSLTLQRTALTCFLGDVAGPKDWNLNTDAHLTVVLPRAAKVAKTFAYRSINETNVPEIREALAKAQDKK